MTPGVEAIDKGVVAQNSQSGLRAGPGVEADFWQAIRKKGKLQFYFAFNRRVRVRVRVRVSRGVDRVEINEEGMEITNTTNPNHETYLVENLRNGYSKKIRSNSTQSDFEPDLKGDESKEIFQDDKNLL